MTPWLLPAAAGAAWAGMLLHRFVGRGGLPASLTALGLLGLGLLLAGRLRREPSVLEGAGLIPVPEPAAAGLRAKPRGRAVPVGPVLLLAGVLLGSAAWSAIRHDWVAGGPLAQLAPARVEVDGWLRTDPVVTRFGWSATLHATRIEHEGQTSRLGGALWLSGDGELPSALRGDRVRIEGFLEVPEDPGFRDYLLGRGLAGTLRADSVARVGPSDNPLLRLAGAARGALRDSIRRLFPPDRAGLLMGLALGDTSGIPVRMTRDFRATGLTHLLAVSGQNVAMVLVPVLALAAWLGLGAKARFAACIATVGFFVVLTGGEPSVLRAGVMASIALTGTVAGRPRAAWPVFGAALIVLLFLDPFLATSVGLQLSAAATCGMLALAGPFAARLTLLPAPVAMAVGTTLAAQLGASPVLLAYFEWVPGTTVLANLLAFPVISPALLLGLAAAAAALVLPPLGWVLARAAEVPMWWLTQVADRMASAPLPALTARGGALPLVVGGAIFVLVVWLVRGRSPRRRLVMAALVALIPPSVLLGAAHAGPPSALTVRFLDVGQGDAALITSPAGATVLIDAGPDPNVVANRLAALGVRRLDAVVATHPHADHIEGFPEVFARLPVGLVLEPGCDEESPSYSAFLHAVDDEDLTVEHPRAGQVLQVGDLALEVLAPPDCYEGTASDANNDSIVLRLEHPDGSVLFPGDAEVESQEALMDGTDLYADVLKVPHHGGDTSADGFFDAVDADLAVVTVGQPNDYGHPVPDVLAALEAAGSRVVRTDERGEVVVTLDGRGVAVGYGA